LEYFKLLRSQVSDENSYMLLSVIRSRFELGTFEYDSEVRIIFPVIDWYCV
jgi:hypothetical protein